MLLIFCRLLCTAMGHNRDREPAEVTRSAPGPVGTGRHSIGSWWSPKGMTVARFPIDTDSSPRLSSTWDDPNVYLLGCLYSSRWSLLRSLLPRRVSSPMKTPHIFGTAKGPDGGPVGPLLTSQNESMGRHR